MTGLALSEMTTVVDSELAVAHLVFKVADLKRSSTRTSAFLHLLLTARSHLLNCVEALIFYCWKLINWPEET
jgi:hypothetical protein